MRNMPKRTAAAQAAFSRAERQLERAYANFRRAGMDSRGDDDGEEEGENVVDALLVVMANVEDVRRRNG